MPISEKDAAALAAMIENEEIEFTELPRDDWPEVLKRSRGRPALSRAANAGERSPQVTVRLPQDLMERARERAEREGMSLSELTREAMKEYLAS